MNESILERFKKQVEEDRLNENNELPQNTSLTNPMDKKNTKSDLRHYVIVKLILKINTNRQ